MDVANIGSKSGVTPGAVCEQLLVLVKIYKAHMVRIAEDHDLTMMQLHTLHSIADGHLTMGKLAHVMHCDASNVTGIIDRLVATSLVLRQEDPQDRRVKTLQLTPQGEAVLEHAMRDLPNRLGCTKLSDRELRSLHATVQKLIS